jgi:hypothetical protein
MLVKVKHEHIEIVGSGDGFFVGTLFLVLGVNVKLSVFGCDGSAAR